MTMLASTGIGGLDEVLGGGVPRNRLYLVNGNPGSGKTTMALQFLMQGLREGERVFYITLSETKEELEAVVESHGWTLDGLHIFELSALDKILASDMQQSVFHPAQVELAEVMQCILTEVDRVAPSRVVLDSVSEVRLLAGDALRYRRQILALKQHFVGRNCTVLLLNDQVAEGADLQLQSLAHGVLQLEHRALDFGGDRRQLRVQKIRGRAFREGFHDYKVIAGGLVVFPRLVAAEHREEMGIQAVSSGVAAFDAMVGGGIERGTATLLIGPSGAGKSTCATQLALAAAERGERVVMYVFDERPETLFHRSAGVGMDLVSHVQSGRITVRQIDPAELSPGEFTANVREAVEKEEAAMVVIDSLTGYLHSMSSERNLLLQLHELLAYLGQRNVISVMVFAQHGLQGATVASVDVSYLADTVILFRYYEYAGMLRQAISAFKKRGGNHERAIRDFSLGPHGLQIGEQLKQFRGVMTGMPLMGPASDGKHAV
ncbi:MAG: AAA family ATPase [Rhodospirillaceae bacterium]|nr:AAA family ATPase [Rhodospirillales bacterium]